MEDWQKEYIEGVLVILPPPPVQELFDGLRKLHDPQSHAISPAHISVTPPLRLPLLTSSKDVISSTLAKVSSFDIKLGPFKTFLPHPVVYCAVQPDAEILKMRESLMALDLFFDSPIKNYISHLTVSEFGARDESEIDLLMKQLGNVRIPEGFHCSELTLLRPDQSFKFYKETTFKLGT